MAHPTSVAPKLESIHLEIRIGSACNICTLQYLLSCNFCFFATFSSMQHLLSCNICPVQQLQHLHCTTFALSSSRTLQHLRCATFALSNILLLCNICTVQHLLSCNSCNICFCATAATFAFVQQLHWQHLHYIQHFL